MAQNIGGITAAVTLVTELYWPYNKEAGQFIWDYIADPAIIIVIALNVLVNVRDSLRIRSQPGSHLAQWPRDVVTALVAIVGVRFLMQYADKIAPDHQATSGLWGHLTALAIVILFLRPSLCGVPPDERSRAVRGGQIAPPVRGTNRNSRQ